MHRGPQGLFLFSWSELSSSVWMNPLLRRKHTFSWTSGQHIQVFTACHVSTADLATRKPRASLMLLGAPLADDALRWQKINEELVHTEVVLWDDRGLWRGGQPFWVVWVLCYLQTGCFWKEHISWYECSVLSPQYLPFISCRIPRSRSIELPNF